MRAELKRLAEAATPGPWFLCRISNNDGTVNIETGRIGQSEWPPAQNCEYGTAEFIAAANPDAILKLIAERDALYEALQFAEEALESWASYASDYFKEKHDLKSDLERIRAALALVGGGE